MCDTHWAEANASARIAREDAEAERQAGLPNATVGVLSEFVSQGRSAMNHVKWVPLAGHEVASLVPDSFWVEKIVGFEIQKRLLSRKEVHTFEVGWCFDHRSDSSGKHMYDKLLLRTGERVDLTRWSMTGRVDVTDRRAATDLLSPEEVSDIVGSAIVTVATRSI